MLKRTILLIIITALLVYMITVNEAKKKRKVQGPGGMSPKKSTSCREFSKYARFNPYSVLNETWFVFFYWAAPRPIQIYRFFMPTSNHTKLLHAIFDGKVTIPVNWTARHVLMQDRLNNTWLLVERGDRGQYWSYMVSKAKKQLIKAQDIRLRQHDNGRLLGLMECVSEHLYVMSRIREVPLHSRIQEEAARFGFRARRGKSYLYQGHEWMPIPEADEDDFFETVIPEIANDTKNPEQITLKVSEEPTDGQKMCNLKKHLSKYKPVDLSSSDSCIQPESTEVSKEVDSDNARTEEADYDNVKTERANSENGRIEEDDSNIERVEDADSETVPAAKPGPDNLKAKQVESDNGRTEKTDPDKVRTEKADYDNIRGQNVDSDKGKAEKADHDQTGAKTADPDIMREETVGYDNLQLEKVDADNIRAEENDSDNRKAEEAGSDKIKTEKVNSHYIRGEKIDSDKGKAGEIDYDKVGAEKVEPDNIREETVDNEHLKEEKATSDNVRIEMTDSGTESQFTNEPKEPGPTNEFVEKSFDIQTQPSHELLGETEKLIEITEDQFNSGLKESQPVNEIKENFEKSANDQMDLLSTSSHTEIEVTTEQKNLRSIDTDRDDITYDPTSAWKDVQTNSYTAILRPVGNQIFIEQKPPKSKNKIKDPIASSGVLPEKCYKMELMSESDEITPAYVPPIFSEIYEKEKERQFQEQNTQ